MADVLEPLFPFRAHILFPAARHEVLKAKREFGITWALKRAREIAEAMTDESLEKRFKNGR